MQRKQQVGECWVCVIFFANLIHVLYIDMGGGAPIRGFGGKEPPKKKKFFLVFFFCIFFAFFFWWFFGTWFSSMVF
jgi:hypothetical protein